MHYVGTRWDTKRSLLRYLDLVRRRAAWQPLSMLSLKPRSFSLTARRLVLSSLGLLALASCASSESDDSTSAATDATAGGTDDSTTADDSAGESPDSMREQDDGAGAAVDGQPAEQSGGASAVAGGQSGGESEGSGAAERPATDLVCACLDTFLQDDSTPVAVRASVVRIEGTCAELRVEEELAEIWGIDVGDVIGGSVEPLCPGGDTHEYAEGDQVLAVYQQHYESYLDCPEYQACTEELCGEQPDGEADISEWDRCDGQCVEDTRQVCDKLTPEQEQMTGTLRLAPLDESDVSFFWAGALRTETLAELSEPECRMRHAEQSEAHQAEQKAQQNANDGMQADAPPPSGGETSAAPEPGPSAMPGGTAPEACLLPGWERYFEDSSPEDGSEDTDAGVREVSPSGDAGAPMGVNPVDAAPLEDPDAG